MMILCFCWYKLKTKQATISKRQLATKAADSTHDSGHESAKKGKNVV
jgi:hypothetical protein